MAERRRLPGLTLGSITPELQVQILLRSDGATIKACEKVCRSLSEAVATPAVQYKLELDIAGMVDGPTLPSGDHPTVERLEKLRAYQKAWIESPMALFPNTSFSDFSHQEISNGGFAFSPTPEDYRWFRPGSALRGYSEEQRDVKKDQIPGFFASFRAGAVDVEQDLLIAIRYSVVEPGCDELHFFSLSRPGPHPCAAPPSRTIRTGRRGTLTSGDVESVHVRGDLVAWKVRQLRFKLQVWNWKIGLLLWQLADESFIIPPLEGTQFTLLDASHLLIFLPERSQIRVYSIDSQAERRDDATQSDFDSYVSLFELPPKLAGVTLYGASLSVSSGGPVVQANLPPHRADQRPPFSHNPTNAIVAIHYISRTDRFSLRTQAYEEFLLLVPLGTLLPMVHAVSEDGRPGRIFPWDEWGPRGSRLVRFSGARPPWISTFGSRCAIVYDSANADSEAEGRLLLRTYILDVHPYAALSGRITQGHLEPPLVSDKICLVDRVGEGSTTTPSDVCTTLPCHVLYRELLVHGPDYGREFYLTEDGLAVYGRFDRQDSNYCGGIYGFSI